MSVEVNGQPIGNPVIDHLDLWSSAYVKKAATGRGSNGTISPYGIQKLRELILELAVRGRLVPQDPDDEPASVLLERVAAEKEAASNKKGRRKPKATPEVTGEERAFELSKGWEWTRLGALAEVVRGVTYKKHDAQESAFEGGIALLRANNIGMSVNFDNLVYVPQQLVRDEQQLVKGDLLIAMSSGSASLVGKAAQFDSNMSATFGAFCGVVRSYSALLFKYLGFFLQTPFYRSQTMDAGKGIGINNLNKGSLENLVVTVPPLAEQHRIVAKVDELMDLCDQLEQQQTDSLQAHQTLVETLLRTLVAASDAESTQQAWNRIAENFDTLFTTEESIDQLKQTILQLAVMGRLVPQDPNDEPASEFLRRLAEKKEELIKEGKIKKHKVLSNIDQEEKPFSLPDGWAWARLPEIGELARGKSKHRPRNDPSLYIDGITPMVQTGDVAKADPVITTYTALYNEKGVAQSRLWPKGTMCITIAANIADTGVLGFEACFPDSVVGFIPFDELIEVKYFDYFVRTAKEHLEDFAPSTAQKNINLEILGKLLVPLPPQKELNRVVAKVDELMDLCDTLKTRIQHAQTPQVHLADAVVEQAIA
ncbi:MAG: restriction endonuclease subunit S [Candidatus Thiodiazotropha sp. (ex Codakia orbicularis)]|nr:restriction endonuclease subunit S [Candidatus Thiodiazotropha sp. (ex Codakia orbicularis)]